MGMRNGPTLELLFLCQGHYRQVALLAIYLPTRKQYQWSYRQRKTSGVRMRPEKEPNKRNHEFWESIIEKKF